MRAVLVLAVAAIVGCAVPRPIAGDFPPITPVEVQQGSFVGERVRWGGVIVETKPDKEETCMEVVSLPLGRRARPRVDYPPFGRVRACAPAFYDPEVFAPGREVTIVGTIQGVERGKVGEQEYDFPRVAAESVYLWPERARRTYVAGYDPYPYAYPYYSYPYYPYSYPYYSYPGPYAYPYWLGWGWYGGYGGRWYGGYRGGHGHGGGYGHGGHGHGGGKYGGHGGGGGGGGGGRGGGGGGRGGGRGR